MPAGGARVPARHTKTLKGRWVKMPTQNIFKGRIAFQISLLKIESYMCLHFYDTDITDRELKLNQ
jgi:hypothetical protein